MFVVEKEQIVYWSGLLNTKNLVTAKSGNVSCRVADDKVLITAHDSYLGRLEYDEIVEVDFFGKLLYGETEPSSEKELHCGIYKKFGEHKIIIHAHAPFTTAFFHYFSELDVFSFEAEFYLGKVPVVEQATPTVTDLKPVLDALEDSNIVVLKNHGVVACGKTFKDAFGLIELLEEQCKVNIAIRKNEIPKADKKHSNCGDVLCEEFELLSIKHGKKLQDLINSDDKAQELGEKHDMTCSFAVKDQETGKLVRFVYEHGKIMDVDDSEQAEFMIIGSTENLKKVFNREISPFTAITQGKVKAKGSFIKMSRWFPVMKRTFELWERVKVK
ncbi:MAG: class II aldolase/adducin family protein [Candidatus Omnitrophica bacterium]|nr:class II aldolase/adducin family protein [Candidatus Omnitrophota bacterium]